MSALDPLAGKLLHVVRSSTRCVASVRRALSGARLDCRQGPARSAGKKRKKRRGMTQEADACRRHRGTAVALRAPRRRSKVRVQDFLSAFRCVLVIQKPPRGSTASQPAHIWHTLTQVHPLTAFLQVWLIRLATSPFPFLYTRALTLCLHHPATRSKFGRCAGLDACAHARTHASTCTRARAARYLTLPAHCLARQRASAAAAARAACICVAFHASQRLLCICEGNQAST